MSPRLTGLSALDPLMVPLPHGTEVTTRVDRQLAERRIPRGAAGRVVNTDGDAVDVLVVGVGVVRYARQEVTPRKVGQLRYAQARAAAWDALTPCVVLETVVGSRAWGLSDEKSDTDRRGVFVHPFPWTTGLHEPPQDLVSLDGSTTYWALRKTVHQALRADPNTLEVLFVDGARALDPMGQWLLEVRGAFVSSLIYGSFGRYALSQLKKLNQSARLAEHRAVVLEWLKEDPPPSLDVVARRLVQAAHVKGPTVGDAELLAKTYIKQLYRSLHDQGLLPASDFAALVWFARNAAAQFEMPRELRPKNAYNLLRLILVALHWLRAGEPSFVVESSWRPRLLAIKRGEVPLDDVLAEAEQLTAELEGARQSTPLPARPDLERADALLRRVGEEVARRHLQGVGGRWGVDAAPPPPVVWEDEQEEG
ncbi:MAG: nucleotidyltransferase domain-containing protein [Myxococcota bacterium]